MSPRRPDPASAKAASQAVTWQPARIPITAADGEGAPDRDGWISSITPHLAMTLADGAYGVTHIPSGCSLAKWFCTRGAATALIRELTAIGDWSRDAIAIRENTAVIEQCYRIRGDIYAREIRGDFGAVDFDKIGNWNRNGTRIEELQHTHELMLRARAKRSAR